MEQASDKAAEAVLGTEGLSAHYAGRQRGRATVKGVSEHARIQDEAYTEGIQNQSFFFLQFINPCLETWPALHG